MNKVDRISQLINQTQNKNNKPIETELTPDQIKVIQQKYIELNSFTYVQKNKLKIGKNVRYYNPQNNKLSTHCTIMDIDYYDMHQKTPKTLLLYSSILNLQWKTSCKHNVFFEQYIKSNKNYNDVAKILGQYGGKTDVEYLEEELAKYLAIVKKDE